jgi:multiple sugar transport system ATP-binding protein
MAGICLAGVTRRYSGGVCAVDNVNLTIADREFLVLVGPSGCGKTTTLRMHLGPGCPFAPRCRMVIDRCHREYPEFRDISPVHKAACWVVDSSS